MGRRGGFLPPAHCQQCEKPPDLGQSLWPGDKWRCGACLENHLPGKDAISKSMHKTIEYTAEVKDAFNREALGLKADGPRNRAEWARMMAVEMKKQGLTRSHDMIEIHGECIDTTMPECLKEPLTIPDLAAVEASLDRSRLLLQSGTNVAAMALDAANSIQARNSLEKMLEHQMAAAHKLVMEQMGQVCYEQNARDQTKRLNAAARCMAVYQQGLLALHKIRQNGQQRITVQYVNVSHGSQAVIGNIERDTVANVGPKPAIPRV
jgi:hypothetical protein